VKSLRVSNLYIRTALSTTDATDTAGISLIANNSIATKNTIDHSRVGIGLSFSSTSNVEISFNNETFVEHGITVGDTNNSSTLTGVKIHDNDLGGGAYLWDSGSANMWHHDPIHVFAVHPGSTTSGVQIYNNYVHGSWGNDQGYRASNGGTHITAALFIETIGPGVQIFNNTIALIGPLNQTTNGLIFLKGSGTVGQQSANARVYNNTLVSDNEGQGIGISSNSGHDIRNNIMAGLAYAIYTPPGSSVATSDYNDFFGATNYGNFNTFSGWQGRGFDAHSKTTDPKLDSNFNLQSTSTILGLGVNLTSLGISALNTDMQGVVRPANGPWDFGAYAHGGTQAAHPNPPSGLAAVVQ
jgi:hypothetical protein